MNHFLSVIILLSAKLSVGMLSGNVVRIIFPNLGKKPKKFHPSCCVGLSRRWFSEGGSLGEGGWEA